MKITVTKRTEINGAVVESTISATTEDWDTRSPMMSEAEMAEAPTDSSIASEMADALFRSISRDHQSRIIKDEAGNGVIVS